MFFFFIPRLHQLTVHLELYHEKRRQHNYLLASDRTSYVSTKVADCRGDSKKLFSLVNYLNGTQTTRAVPNRDSEAVATAKLANLFEAKVSQIRYSLDSTADDASLTSPLTCVYGFRYRSVTVPPDGETSKRILNLQM
jgi:hypothetical protein